MTRREILLAPPAALLAQTPTQTPQPPPIPQTPEAELQAAREQQRRNGEQLSAVKLPMSAEPACHFRP